MYRLGGLLAAVGTGEEKSIVSRFLTVYFLLVLVSLTIVSCVCVYMVYIRVLGLYSYNSTVHIIIIIISNGYSFFFPSA